MRVLLALALVLTLAACVCPRPFSQDGHFDPKCLVTCLAPQPPCRQREERTDAGPE